MRVTDPYTAGGIPFLPADGDGSMVRVRGRSLAARAADAANVLDAYGPAGADKTGANDSAAAFSAALSAIGAAGGCLSIPSGSYRLDSNVIFPDNATIEFSATKFSGAGLITNSGDWTQYQSRRSRGYLHTTTAPGNEFALVSMMSIGPTSANSNTEKAAGSFLAQTSDPSKYTDLGDSVDATADAVGVRGVGVINPGNQRGRAFGGEFYGFISPGSKGASAGAEFGIDNRSGDLQPLNYKYNSSNIISVFSKGNTPVANGIFLGQGGAGTGMYSVITVQQQAALNWVFSILQTGTAATVLAGWRPDGSILATGLTTTGTTVFNTGYFASSGTIVGDNSLTLNSGPGSNPSSVRSTTGPVQIAGGGNYDTLLGSGTSAAVVQSTLFTAGDALIGGRLRPGSYTVGTLPGGVAGALIYVSNARKIAEGAGAGTGVVASYSNGNWRRLSDDSPVAA